MLGGFAVILTIGLVTWNNWWKYSYFETFWRSRNFIFISTINYGLFNLLNQNVLDFNRYFNETSKLSLFLYCMFRVCGSILGMNRKILVQGFNAHDCPDGIRNDSSNGGWDPCWNTVRSRLET